MALTLAIVLLGLYAILRDAMVELRNSIVNHRRIRQEGKSSTEEAKKFSLDDALRILAAILLFVAFIWIYYWWEKLLYFFVVFIICMYAVITVFAIKVVRNAAISGRKGSLGKDENLAVAFIGLIAGMFALAIPIQKFVSGIDQIFSGWGADIAKYIFATCSYAILFFFLIILSRRLLKDAVWILVKTTNRICKNIPFGLNSLVRLLTDLIVVLWRSPSLYKRLSGVLHPKGGRRSIPFRIILTFASIITLVELGVRYLLCIVAALLSLGISGVAHLKKTLNSWAEKLINRSEYEVVLFSFRLAVVAAMLFIVIANRYTDGVSEKATAVLEFFASVIVIPIGIEWLQSMRKSKAVKASEANAEQTQTKPLRIRTARKMVRRYPVRKVRRRKVRR